MDSTIVTPFYSLPLRRQDEEDNNSIIDISTLVSDISSSSSDSSDSDYSDDDDDSLDSLIEKLYLGEHERATELISNRTYKHADKVNNKPHLKYFDAVVILATFNTSGSIILIPWSYGQLGYIVGPLTHLAIVGMSLYFSCFLIDVATTNIKGIKCRTLGDVGFILAGRFGRRLFVSLQMLNMILYIPVAMETVGLSLQYLSGYKWNCIGYWNLTTFGILLILLQFVKNWKKAAWLAYITTALAAAKAYGLLPFAFAYYEDEIKSSDEYLGPVQAAGNPENNWHDLALAVSAFSYTFAPNFILIEVMSDMKDKTSCKSALYTSTVLQVSFYLVAGLVGVALWGWNVTDPVTLEIPEGSWIGLLLSAMIAVAVCLDYLIASKVVNDWTRRTLFSKWEKGSGCREVSRHFFITLLTTSISLGMVLAIPDLSTLVGVVTGVCAIGMNTWAISLAWVWGGKVIKARGSWFMYAAGTVCLPYTVWVIAATAYNIANTDYRSAENFFCKG